jgi:hypothetical protein
LAAIYFMTHDSLEMKPNPVLRAMNKLLALAMAKPRLADRPAKN